MRWLVVSFCRISVVLLCILCQYANEYCFPSSLSDSPPSSFASSAGLTHIWMVLLRGIKSLQVGWFFLLASGVFAVVASAAYWLIIKKLAVALYWISSWVGPLTLLVGSTYVGWTALTVGSRWESRSTSTTTTSLAFFVEILDWVLSSCSIN